MGEFKMDRRRRMLPRRILTLVCLVVGMLVGACAPRIEDQPTQAVQPTVSPPEPTAKAAQQEPTESGIGGQVTIWLDWNPDELQGLRQVITSFQERYPDIGFSLAYHRTDLIWDDFTHNQGASGSPTVLIGPSSWGPELLDRGWSLNVNSLIDAELVRTVHPIAWSQARQARTAYGLPVELHGILLYRNSAIYPEESVTVDDFVNTAKSLKSESGIQTILDLEFMNASAHMDACGGSFYDSFGGFNLTTESGVCWLTLLQAYGRAGRVLFNVDDDLELFTSAETAWLVEESNQIGDLEAAIGADNLAIDAWPIYSPTNRALSSLVWTDNVYLITNGTQADQEASWAFMRFLLTPEAQTILSEPATGANLPVIIGVELEDPTRAQALAVLLRGSPLPLFSTLPLLADPLTDAIEDVVVHGADIPYSFQVSADRVEAALLKQAEDD